ncbi:MAG: molecular chaperone HtpG [Clostridia bacterium]|nr:molecular chaperone HtpG [Clostridia bacterium]
MKQFKTESKKMLDMMINSVYTNREIFLRELISNASDAIDKRYFRSLTDSSLGLERDKYGIDISIDKENRIIKITDNGCGMTECELEENLSTIAHSGSGTFKSENTDENISIIGQFGVGFYSAFMISKKISVRTRAIGSDTAFCWESEGTEGYTITPCDYEPFGSEITLFIKEDTETENFTEFLDQYKIKELVKRYSDYIRYPIRMDMEVTKTVESEDEKAEPKYETVIENQTLNSMVPLWHKPSSEVNDEQYADFYKATFYDYNAPLKTIQAHIEGTVEYETLMFIPQKAPFDYYSKGYEKGLTLYSNGVMIMDKCSDLLPDYFNFVKGVVDSSDLTLNISRETLQQNYQLRTIAKSLEKKIRTELLKLMKEDREKYTLFFKEFGAVLKFGVYNEYGANKDTLKDLLVFKSDATDKYISLKEYTEAMPEEQKAIYYASAATEELAKSLPRTSLVRSKGYDVLLFTDEVDEFVATTLMSFADKNFVNVTSSNLDLSTDDEKESVKTLNEENKELLDFMGEVLKGEVKSVRFSNTVGEHPVSLISEGYLSAEMARVLSQLPGHEGMALAQTVLEINMTHSLKDTLKSLFETDKDKLTAYTEILYAQARLISGLEIKDPVKLSSQICDLMV